MDLPTKLSKTSVDAKHVLMGSMTFHLLLDRVGFCPPCCQAAWLLWQSILNRVSWPLWGVKFKRTFLVTLETMDYGHLLSSFPPDPPSPDCFLRCIEIRTVSRGNQFQISHTNPQLCFHHTHSSWPWGLATCPFAADHDGWGQTPSKGGCGDRVKAWSSATTGHKPSNKPLVSNSGRRKKQKEDMRPAENVFFHRSGYALCVFYGF